jgi:hypothetical protein
MIRPRGLLRIAQRKNASLEMKNLKGYIGGNQWQLLTRFAGGQGGIASQVRCRPSFMAGFSGFASRNG